jgi:FAD/FMN-containing dehydrogenase
MPALNLRDVAYALNVTSVGGIVRKKGGSWPPPPPISVRTLLAGQPEFQWTNYELTRSEVPFSYRRPRKLEEIVTIVKNAEANGRRVHAVGSGWSFSDCAMTPDVMVDMRFLNGEIGTVGQAFNGHQPPAVVHVQAGITIRDLYTLLDGRRPPLALETMGGASGQTLAGAVSTGTHGGDKFIGPLADSVLAIHLVGAGGAQYWIEPSAPITDRILLRQFVVPQIPPENIRYDDDWFNAILVSVGCMGIIYALVLRVRPQYNLLETTVTTTWAAFKQNAPLLLADQSHRFLQVVLNPYTDASGDNFALMTVRSEPSPPPDPSPPTVQNPTGVQGAMEGLLNDLIGADPLPGLAEAMAALLKLAVGADVRAILIQLVNVVVLNDLSNQRLILTTDYSNILSALCPPITLYDTSYRVMDRTRFRPGSGPADQNPPPIQQDPPPTDSVGGYSIEVSFPAANFADVVDWVLGLVNADTGTFLTGYFALRFTGPTRAFLGMQQWSPTCSLEISVLPNVQGELDLLASIVDGIYNSGFSAVLHWGQLLDFHVQGHGDRYQNYAKWQQVYAQLSNNFSVRTFENNLSTRWQLT